MTVFFQAGKNYDLLRYYSKDPITVGMYAAGGVFPLLHLYETSNHGVIITPWSNEMNEMTKRLASLIILQVLVNCKSYDNGGIVL